MTKQENIIKLREMLREKRGYPEMPYLNKLSESDIFDIMLSVGASQAYLKNQIKGEIRNDT